MSAGDIWWGQIGNCLRALSDVATCIRDSRSVVLELPENLHVAALLPMGYPADGAKPAHLHSKIRPAEETITYL